MTEGRRKNCHMERNMALKSVESQNVEFKSKWRDAAGDV